MRLLFAWPVYHSVVVRAPDSWAQSAAPNGIARWVDLSFAVTPEFQAWWIPVMAVALVCYVLGLLPILATLLLFLGQVLLGTMSNSLGGAIHHTGQVVAIVLFGQLVAHLVHLQQSSTTPGASVLDRIRAYYADWGRSLVGGGAVLRDSPGELQPHDRWIRYSQQFFAATYVASGISKLIASGGEWISTVPRIALQLEKTRASRYYDYLKDEGSEFAVTAGRLIGEHPTMAKLFFGGGLFLELFCFLALIGRLPLLVWGLALLTMHLSISTMMGLGFDNHKWLLLIFFMNLPYWLWRAVELRRGKSS